MSDLLLTREGPLAFITLARPAKLNALTPGMGDALARHVQTLNADPSVRMVLLRAEGRSFCAGGDLDFLRANLKRDFEANRETMLSFYGDYLSLLKLEVPSVALIQGRATGAGLTLALGCDMRIACEDALVSVNFVKLGLSPGMGATFMLERLIGPARAAEMLFTGRDVPMGEALAIGLVNHVVQADQLEEAGRSLAERMGQAGPEAVRLTKAMTRASLAGLSEALAREASAQATCFAGSELGEGLRALAERRPARFSDPSRAGGSKSDD